MVRFVIIPNPFPDDMRRKQYRESVIQCIRFSSDSLSTHERERGEATNHIREETSG